MDNKKNGYEYTRYIFNWSIENPEKSNPTLIALYLFLVEKNNQLFWCENFGITASECMNFLRINSYNTYKKNFDILVENNFIQIVKKSINQYQCNIIALSNFNKANDKALNKALNKANDKALNKASEAFIKQETINYETLNNETIFFAILKNGFFIDFLKSENLEINSIKNKKEKSPEEILQTEIFNIIKNAFIEFYFLEKNIKYQFSAKDAGSIKGIISKIKSVFIDSNKRDPNQNDFKDSIIYVLRNLKEKDIWIYDNLSLSLLNSKFNELISKIKNGKHVATAANDSHAKLDAYSRELIERATNRNS